MLVLSLIDNELTQSNLDLSAVDCLECRLDINPNLEINALKLLQKPLIFTLRHVSHGGNFQGSIESLGKQIFDLCGVYCPQYVDLDCRMPGMLFSSIRESFPNIKIIASYHQFNADLTKLKQYLHFKVDCDILKLAMVCDHASEVLKLLQLKSHKPLALVPMGERASFGRVIAKILGNHLDYVALNPMQKTAAGQLTLEEMLDIYHYPALNEMTKIYALLAKPVAHSVGHIFHNQYFRAHQQNAVYVKIEQDVEGFQELLTQMLTLPFYGLSLSMPLKQAFKPKLIVNTLCKQAEKWISFNTDGQAVVDLLDLKASDRVLCLGKGGAAKGIAEAFERRGIRVSFLGRKNADFDFEDELPEFDCLINTLPSEAYDERPFFKLKLQKLCQVASKALDVIYHETSIFQELAFTYGLCYFSGLQMFERQAKLQQELWKSN